MGAESSSVNFSNQDILQYPAIANLEDESIAVKIRNGEFFHDESYTVAFPLELDSKENIIP